MVALAWTIIALVIVFIFVLLVTVGTHVWCQMPYVPTTMGTTAKMIELAQCKSGDVVYDLGAGDARVIIEAKKRVPGIRAIGYEIALGVWLLAQLRKLWSRVDVDIHMKSFFEKNLSDANVIFLYLSPAVMQMLIPKFKAELKPGTRIVSHCFKLGDIKPKLLEHVQVPMWGKQKVYLYEW